MTNPIVAQAERWLGTTETAPNVVPGITDRWGINGQPWCMGATRTWTTDAGLPNFGPGDPFSMACDPVSAHVHQAGNFSPLQLGKPGDVVIFSWYPWAYRSGVRSPWDPSYTFSAAIPTITSGVYAGLPAGDHVGIIDQPFDGSGYVTIEGNTSADDAGSQDNGDGVWRKWRHLSLICCVIPTADRAAPAPIVPPTPDGGSPEVFEMPEYLYHRGAAGQNAGDWYPVYANGFTRSDVTWEEVQWLRDVKKIPVVDGQSLLPESRRAAL